MEFENPVKNAIVKNISDRNVIFVFPTETSAQLWADWTIENSEVTGFSAVPMERFTAWDTFKGKAIKAQKQDKDSVPSMMRKIFTSWLIDQNRQGHFFRNLIMPEYAGNASSFEDWISSLLPSLKMWKDFYDDPNYKKIAEEKNLNASDDEDRDYLELYRRYSDFLDENNLFDPAWEQPPFEADGHKYIIMFPEILQDFQQYRKILSNTPDIELVSVPKNVTKEYKSFFYPNARIELHAVAEYLRKVHDEDGIDWKDIAINVPEMENYGSYLNRELDLYEIPHSMRYSKPLSSNGAGSFFSQLQDCVTSDFSFASVKSLLLNNEIPWKNPERIQNLIHFGKENNCLVSFNYQNQHFDVWEKSFEKPKDWTVKTDPEKTEEFQELWTFYRQLKSSIEKLVKAESFDDIHKKYSVFRETYFDKEKFSDMPMSDKILSRCITELCNLVDLEKEFPKYKVSSPYKFFVNDISNTEYLAQSETSGVQVFPYRAAAASPFKVHLILNAGQDSLSVSKLYRQLSFLSETKRNLLKEIKFEESSFKNEFSDIDPTEDFIKLYTLSAENQILFTSCEKTFGGYAFPNGFLKTEEIKDFKKKEFVFENEKNGFENWKSFQKMNDEKENFDSESLKDKIKSVVCAYGISKGEQNPKINVNQTALKDFFFCPRYWILNDILKLSEEELETELLDPFAKGNINHLIFQNFCTALKEKNLKLSAPEGTLPEEYMEILRRSTEEAIRKFKKSAMTNELLLGEHEKILADILPAITEFSKTFEGFTVKHTEKSLTVNMNEKFYFYGKIDCILSDDNGELTIIDFKSSKAPKNLEIDESNPEELPDFQLEMYDYLCGNTEEEKLSESENCGFFVLKDQSFTMTKGKLPDSEEETSDRNDSFENVKKLLLEKSFEYVDKIEKMDFSIDDELVTYEKCASCAMRTVCRKHFTVSGRK